MTIKELRATNRWIKCHSIEQAQAVGREYGIGRQAWQDFDFHGYGIPIYCYIAEDYGGFNPTIREEEQWIDFTETEFFISNTYQIY